MRDILKIAKSITAFLCGKSIISEKMAEVYEYGFMLLLSSLVETFNILLISAAMGYMVHGMIYLLCIMIIRSYTGGYHADTPFRCNVVFVVTYLLSLIIWHEVIKYRAGNWLVWYALLISFVYVVINAPVQNHNKVLSVSEAEKNRKISVIIYVCCMVLMLILDITGRMTNGRIMAIVGQYCLYIKIILINIALMMFIGKVKEEQYGLGISLKREGGA